MAEAHVLNQATNFPVQATAADLTKLAMLAVSRELSRDEGVLIGQVHDSLLVDCPRECVPKVERIVRGCMEDPGTSRFGFDFDVPLEVDVKWGANWLKAEEGEGV